VTTAGRWMPGPPRNPLVRSTATERARVAADVVAMLDQAADDLLNGCKFSALVMHAAANISCAELGMTLAQSLASFAICEESPAAAFERIGGGQ